MRKIVARGGVEAFEGSVPRLSTSIRNYEFVLKIGDEEHAWVCRYSRIQSLAELAYRKREPVVGVTVRDQEVISIAVPQAIKKTHPAAARKYQDVTVIGFTATENKCDIVVEYSGRKKRATVVADQYHVQRMLEISYETNRKLMFIDVDENGRVIMANLSRPAPKKRN